MSPQRRGRKIAHKLNWNRDRIQDRAEAEARAEMYAMTATVLQQVGERMRQALSDGIRRWLESPEADSAFERMGKAAQATIQDIKQRERPIFSMLNAGLPQPATLPTAPASKG